MTIEQIPMSVRSYNALKNYGITTIDNFINITEVELRGIRNLGVKSIEEILMLQQRIKSGDNLFNNTNNKPVELRQQLIKEIIIMNHISNYRGLMDNYQVKVLNLFKEWVNNIHIDDLKLSVRPTNVLLAAGIESVQDLLTLTIQELRDLPQMGQKSVDEILNCLYERTHVVEINEISLKHHDMMKPILEYFNRDIEGCHTSFNWQEIISCIDYIFSSLSKEDMEHVLSLVEMNSVTSMDKILEYYVYSDSTVINLLKNYIVDLVGTTSFTPIANEEIIQQMPISMQKKLAQYYIDELVNEKRIEYFDNGIRIHYPSILEYVESISKPNVQYALSSRLRGETLEEIGSHLNVTRERARQLTAKALGKRPPYVREDEYRDLYENYDFKKESFLSIFKVDDYVYNYLKIICKKGSLPLEALLEDSRINSSIRKRTYFEVYRDYLHIGDNLIKKERTEICCYLLSQYGKQGIDVEDFWKLYHDFIVEHDLSEQANLNYPLCSMENYLIAHDCVVWTYGRKLRYYPIKTYDFETFFRTIQWEQYQDVELSTYKIFCDHLQVMMEYDIHDEYELHNIIKKLPVELVGQHVKILRMPYLAFGECDRDMQIIELMIELSPVKREKLAETFEERYGHRRETMTGYFSKVIDEYFYNGIYRVAETPLSREEFSKLKLNLMEEFYFIDDVKKIYLNLFPNGDVKKVNAYNIKQLGFKVNSNYLFSNQYTSADAFFRNLLTRNDRIDLTGNYSRLWNISSFFSVLKELREKFELFEYAPSQFIHYRRLEQAGITKSYLMEYIEDILQFVNDEYFTIHSLRLKGYVHDLDQLGFDDWFYASLIRQDVSIQYRRFKDGILLKKQVETISLSDFLEELLKTLKSIDVYDFIDWVRSKYGLELDRGRLLETIKTTSLHYDSIMDKIYLNYETYYQEV